jgi:hypothetical protein
MHRRSVLHQKIKRLRALLANDCLTFREIGRRLGVSRESVRLMARTLGAKTGKTRRRACTRANRNVPPHIKRIIRRVHEAGLEASPIYRKGNQITPRELIVEGRKVGVAHLWYEQRLAAYRIKVRPWNGARFVIFYVDELSQLLIVPISEVRAPAVVLGRERRKRTRESRLLRYLNAWYLLRPRSFGERGRKGKKPVRDGKLQAPTIELRHALNRQNTIGRLRFAMVTPPSKVGPTLLSTPSWWPSIVPPPAWICQTAAFMPASALRQIWPRFECGRSRPCCNGSAAEGWSRGCCEFLDQPGSTVWASVLSCFRNLREQTPAAPSSLNGAPSTFATVPGSLYLIAAAASASPNGSLAARQAVAAPSRTPGYLADT